MRFTNQKRRQPPAVIIISLIDVLIIMLIFLMVTTTFKQHPAVKISLPESKQAKEGVSEEGLIVTIAKTEPSFWLGPRQVTLDRLQQELVAQVAKNPNISLSVRIDKEAAFGKWLSVIEAARAAGIKKTVPLYTKSPGEKN